MFQPSEPSDARPPRRPAASRNGRRRQYSALDHFRRGSYRADRHGPLAQVDRPELASRPPVLPRSEPPRQYLRGPADAAALEAGYRWDGKQGAYACRWISTQLQLVEGPWAGQPFELMKWQTDFLMRLFSWVKFEPEWARYTLRYRRALLLIAKKNGKSPFAAALSLFLAYGFHHADPGPETGAEVILVAKDKIQTENVFKHCRRMVKAHPRLADECHINENVCRILHQPTDTAVRALAHNPDQLEGLNPRAMIADELHVWKNQRTWDAIRYAGASRPDFLLLAITTAGEDRNSICYSQYEYGKHVIAGRIVDHEYLPVIYEADDEDDWTIARTWRKANPSIGRTVKTSELRSACTEAKFNARLVPAFRRYRLNCWTHTESAWLDSSYWAECRADFDLAVAQGFTCNLALDLSRTRDLTAAALTWLDPADDIVYCWAHFWLPEETARRRNHETPFLEWAAQGYLTLTPGDTVDYAVLLEDLAKLSEQTWIGALIYDPWNAEHITQEIEQRLGVPRIKFPQTISNYTGPSKEFERRILANTLRHPGNPILTWQASHVLAYTDPSGNIRPVRRVVNDHRTIDGISAVVMSLAQTVKDQPTTDFSFGLT